MNRKFHHSISALVASAAFLVLGLVAAVPGASPSMSPSTVHVASQTGNGFGSVIATPTVSRAGKSARRQRHRLVMPYFSFSSRS